MTTTFTFEGEFSLPYYYNPEVSVYEDLVVELSVSSRAGGLFVKRKLNRLLAKYEKVEKAAIDSAISAQSNTVSYVVVHINKAARSVIGGIWETTMAGSLHIPTMKNLEKDFPILLEGSFAYQQREEYLNTTNALQKASEYTARIADEVYDARHQQDIMISQNVSETTGGEKQHADNRKQRILFYQNARKGILATVGMVHRDDKDDILPVDDTDEPGSFEVVTITGIRPPEEIPANQHEEAPAEKEKPTRRRRVLRINNAVFRRRGRFATLESADPISVNLHRAGNRNAVIATPKEVRVWSSDNLDGVKLYVNDVELGKFNSTEAADYYSVSITKLQYHIMCPLAGSLLAPSRKK